MTTELWQRLKVARERGPKALRRGRPITQDEIAVACAAELGKKLSRVAVGYWEYANPEDRTQPNISQLKVISMETGVALLWLIEDGETLDPKPISNHDATSPQPATLTARKVPIRGAPMFEQDGFWTYSASRIGAYVEWPSYQDDVYAIEISTDRFYPEVRNGVLMMFSGSKSPVFGEYVLLRRKDGRSSIFEFLQEDERQVSLAEIGAKNRVTIARENIESIHAWVGTAPASVKQMDTTQGEPLED